jgi:hypothetical protein
VDKLREDERYWRDYFRRSGDYWRPGYVGTYPGYGTNPRLVVTNFYNYKSVRNRDNYAQEDTRYGIYYERDPVGRPTPYAEKMSQLSRRALGILERYVLSDMGDSDLVTAEPNESRVIGLKYSTTVSWTNTTTQNILYSHYLRDNAGKYIYKIDNFPTIPPACLYNLPENDIDNPDNVSENTIEFKVEIFVYWRVYPTIVLDHPQFSLSPYVEIDPQKVVLDITNGKMVITKTIYDPKNKYYSSVITEEKEFTLTTGSYKDLINVLNREYFNFRKQYYYPNLTNLFTLPNKGPVIRNTSCTDDCDRPYNLSIQSRIASQSEYRKQNVFPLSIITTESIPPESLPNLVRECVEIDNADNSANTLKCDITTNPRRRS